MAQIIGDNLLAGFIDNHFLMVLAQTVISTLIILVTGEFLPKTLFKINPNLVLNVAAIPLFICYVILYPVSKLSSGLSCLFLRIFGMKVNKDASDKAFGNYKRIIFSTNIQLFKSTVEKRNSYFFFHRSLLS